MRTSSVLASAIALSMFLSVICLVPDHSSAQPGAALLPPCVEYTQDTDLDGLIDFLVFDVSFEVYEAGDYTVSLRLNDSESAHIYGCSFQQYRDVGTYVVSCPIEGVKIWDHGVDGPYVAQVLLHTVSPWAQIDEFLQATEPYLYTEFEPSPILFTGPPEVSGLDVDGNGRYEFLVIDFEVEVGEADDYEIRYSVISYNPPTVVYIADTGFNMFLDVGIKPLSISVRGSLVDASGVNGPYQVYVVLNSPDYSYLDDAFLMTEVYAHDDFEAGSFTSALSPSGPTVDGIFGEGEWDGATLVDLGRPDMENPFGVVMLVKNNLTHLQVCLDAVSDVTEELGDCAAVSFDTGDDNEATDGHEDQFLVGSSFAGQTVHLVYSEASSDWELDCGPFDPTMPSHGGLAAASGFGPSPSLVDDHRIYEFAVPLELIGAVPGTVIGFAVSSDLVHGVFDESLNNGSSWPYFMEPGAPLMHFGDLTIGWPPIETSASMSGTLGNSGWYVSPVNVTLTATGGQMGVDRTMFELDGEDWEEYVSPVECAKDGQHALDYRSYDLGGAAEAIESLEFKIDVTVPVSHTSLSDWNVTLSATDLTSGVQRTVYRIDNGTWLNYTDPIQLSRDVNHTVEYYSVDFAGNTEETMTLEVEKEAVEDDDGQGGGGLGFLSWDFFIVLAIIALIALIAIPAIFGMRRKAKESDARAAIKDIGTSVMQMADDTNPPKAEQPPKKPGG